MKNRKLLIAILVITILVLSLSLMSCSKKNKETTWGTIMNTTYNAKERAPEYSQIDEVTISAFEAGKTYQIKASSFDSNYVVLLDDGATVNSFVIFNTATSASVKVDLGQDIEPINLDTEILSDGLILIKDDTDDINFLVNGEGTKLIESKNEITERDGVYVVDNRVYVYENNTLVRCGVPAAIAGRNAYGYFYQSDDWNIYIYNKDGSIAAKLEKDNFNHYLQPQEVILPNGDLMVTYLTPVEYVATLTTEPGQYDVAILNNNETDNNPDDDFVEYFTKEQYLLSAKDGSVTKLDLDYIPYMCGNSKDCETMLNAKLADGYVGIILGMPIVNRKLQDNVWKSVAIKSDGSYVEIKDFNAPNKILVASLIDDNVLVKVEYDNAYTSCTITFFNEKGEFIGCFADVAMGNYGMKYVSYDDIVYNLDGSVKYTLIKDKETIVARRNSYFAVYNSETNAVKIFYKNNEAKAFECADPDDVMFNEIYIIYQKADSTEIYKVDGTYIKTLNTTFIESAPTKSGLLAISLDGKYYLAK